jgi:hypothetical protein
MIAHREPTSSGRLTVHTDPDVQRPDLPLVPMIHGLFRDLARAGELTSWEQRFGPWWNVASRYLVPGSLIESDVAILPLDWYWVRGPSWWNRVDRDLMQRAIAFAARVRDVGKPLIVFFSGDRSHEAIPLPGAVVFREGPYRSRWSASDVALPAFPEDLVAHFFEGELPMREWSPRPVVGFCGLAGRRTSLADLGKLALYHARMLAVQHWADVSPYKGENLRVDALARIADAPGLQTNFVIRQQSVFFRDGHARDLTAVRREYVENLAGSDYVLCCRGSGNYSYRLYETLCLGRIPVFIDTDCVLPWEGAIPWKECCVWIDEDDIDGLGERIRAFHDAMTPSEFQERQRKNREVWRHFLAPDAFFARACSTMKPRETPRP